MARLGRDASGRSASGMTRAFDCALSVCEEMIPDNGEDSFLFSVNEAAAVAGVFDGCGGSGARKYPQIGNKTGAYIASRIVSGAVLRWFAELTASDPSRPDGGALEASVTQRLRRIRDISEGSGESRLTGSMSLEFPTTAVIALCSPENGAIGVDYFWAGDSRGYLLDENGLAQITLDDVEAADAMENLSQDGVLTNVISASRSWRLHRKHLRLDRPAVVITATDGCFGYFSTPMEFEGALLGSLHRAKTPAAWEQALAASLGKYACDDYTLCALVFGYGSFESLRGSLARRDEYLCRQYLYRIADAAPAEKEAMWRMYRSGYYRYTDSGTASV